VTTKILGLVSEVEDLVASDENQRRIDVQTRLNSLEAVHPTPFNAQAGGIGFSIVVLAWSNRLGMEIDIDRVGRMLGEIDPAVAESVVEYELRQKIESFKTAGDDIPISPGISTNLGLTWMYRKSAVGEVYDVIPESGVFVATPILKTEKDFDNLRLEPFDYDKDLNKRRIAAFDEIVDGRLPVTDESIPGQIGAPFQTANNLRGVQEILEDFVERPELVHRLMEFVTESILTHTRARNAALYEGNRMGGVFGCDEVSCDMFSPAMYDEFVYPYECRVAELYSSIYYHSWHFST